MKYVLIVLFLIFISSLKSKAQQDKLTVVPYLLYAETEENILFSNWTEAKTKYKWLWLETPKDEKKVFRSFYDVNNLSVVQKTKDYCWTQATLPYEPFPPFWYYETKLNKVNGGDNDAETGLLLTAKSNGQIINIYFLINHFNQTYYFSQVNTVTNAWGVLNKQIVAKKNNFSSAINKFKPANDFTSNTLKIQRDGYNFLLFINNKLVENIKISNPSSVLNKLNGIGILGKGKQGYSVDKIKFVVIGDEGVYNTSSTPGTDAAINFGSAQPYAIIYDWIEAKQKFKWVALQKNTDLVSRYFTNEYYLTVEQKHAGKSWTYARMTPKPFPDYWTYQASFSEAEGKTDKSEIGLLLKTSIDNEDEMIIFSINSLNQTYRLWHYNNKTEDWRSLNNKLKPDEFNFSPEINKYDVANATANNVLQIRRNGDAFLIYINYKLIETIKVKVPAPTTSNSYGIGIYGKGIQKYKVGDLKFLTYGVEITEFLPYSPEGNNTVEPTVVTKKKEEYRKYTEEEVYKAEEELINYLNASDRELNPLLAKILRSGKDAWILYKTKERAHTILFSQISNCETFLKEYGKYTTTIFRNGVETRLSQAMGTNSSF